MARTLQDAKLDTRAARQRLKQRREPYWRSLSEGLAVGYRKGAKGGTWIARHYSEEHGRRYQSIGTADDVLDADGVHVLSFDQAQKEARTWFAKLAKEDSGEAQVGPCLVKEAVEDYLTWLEENRKGDGGARYKAEAHILPVLGQLDCGKITTEQIRRWLRGLANSPALLRSKTGAKKRNTRKLDKDDPEAVRRRQASANRTWTVLRAALNRAWREGKVASDAAWRRVEPFDSVDGVRVRYLQIAECTRLINGADGDFRPMVQAALLTGGRYGQVAKLTVGDFNADAGTVTMRTRKGKGKVRIHHCHLTPEGIEFFKAACLKRAGTDDLIFKRADGESWKDAHQIRRIKEASDRAKIDPPANFHVLRHTWASHAVMNGTPLMVVAKNLGHRDTRMVEKHYGHLAPSYVADEIKKKAPTFGIKADINVSSLDEHRAKVAT